MCILSNATNPYEANKQITIYVLWKSMQICYQNRCALVRPTGICVAKLVLLKSMVFSRTRSYFMGPWTSCQNTWHQWPMTFHSRFISTSNLPTSQNVLVICLLFLLSWVQVTPQLSVHKNVSLSFLLLQFGCWIWPHCDSSQSHCFPLPFPYYLTDPHSHTTAGEN